MTTFGISFPLGRLWGVARGEQGGLGYATGNITLESECVNGEKANITVRYHVGYGSYGLPAIATGGRISFQDNKDSIVPSIFNGHISFSSVGVASVLGGVNYTAISVGQVNSIGPGVSFGMDAGIGNYEGTANVIRSTRSKCGCE